MMGIETTAAYDPATQEFIINTPTNDASKVRIPQHLQGDMEHVVDCK